MHVFLGEGGGERVTPFKGYEPRVIKGVYSEGQLSVVHIHGMFHIFDEYYSNTVYLVYILKMKF